MGLEGKILGGRYEIIEKIGNGGMATVYKAKCLVLKRYVAVKVLREEFTTDNEFVRRFNVEAQSVASLTHPNIVSVYDENLPEGALTLLHPDKDWIKKDIQNYKAVELRKKMMENGKVIYNFPTTKQTREKVQNELSTSKVNGFKIANKVE